MVNHGPTTEIDHTDRLDTVRGVAHSAGEDQDRRRRQRIIEKVHATVQPPKDDILFRAFGRTYNRINHVHSAEKGFGGKQTPYNVWKAEIRWELYEINTADGERILVQ